MSIYVTPPLQLFKYKMPTPPSLFILPSETSKNVGYLKFSSFINFYYFINIWKKIASALSLTYFVSQYFLSRIHLVNQFLFLHFVPNNTESQMFNFIVEFYSCAFLSLLFFFRGRRREIIKHVGERVLILLINKKNLKSMYTFP